ncbi:MAG: multicopper oxidase domain-containing protein, partial [Nitrosopumilaceae archaeon]
LVTHLHGAEVQSYSDGVPTQWFTYNGLHGPGYYTLKETAPNSAVYLYPNVQQPTTLWYHDHALGITRINMMAGLAGFYLIREPDSSIDYVKDLLPQGKYEMPIMIQDRTFNADGSLFYPETGINPDVNPYWNHAFLGNTIVVNGKVWPNLNVDRCQYRFRILDSSNTRIYSLSCINSQTGETIPMVQIGSDGGYLKSSVTVKEIIISPSERVDVLIDFSDLSPGTKVILKNTLLTYDFPNEDETIGNIMQFTVTNEEGFKPENLPTLLNPTLEGNIFPNLPSPERQRILPLFQVNGQLGPLYFLLNGQLWSGIITETPRVGDTEEWVFVDLTNNGHPMHIHLIQFQIVSRQDINVTRYAADWISLQRELLGNNTAAPPWPTDFIPQDLPVEPYLIRSSRPPALNEIGWKDTVLVYPNTVTTIRARWASQDGTPFPFDATVGPGYVWHCHILEHEDNEMMRPYKVLPSLGNTNFPILEIGILALIIILAMSLFFILRRRKIRKKE